MSTHREREHHGGHGAWFEMRLRWAARIRYGAELYGLSIREAFRRTMRYLSRSDWYHIRPWATVEAFEEFCASRRHRGRIEREIERLRACGGAQPVKWTDALGMVPAGTVADPRLGSREDAAFVRRTLAAYGDAVRRGGDADELAQRYTRALTSARHSQGGAS